jgi:hypothetical protein
MKTPKAFSKARNPRFGLAPLVSTFVARFSEYRDLLLQLLQRRAEWGLAVPAGDGNFLADFGFEGERGFSHLRRSKSPK